MTRHSSRENILNCFKLEGRIPCWVLGVQVLLAIPSEVTSGWRQSPQPLSMMCIVAAVFVKAWSLDVCKPEKPNVFDK